MALPIEVTLPKSVTPRFPDRCVACGGDSPDGTLRMTTHTVGWWTWVLLAFGKLFHVEVPCCDGCRSGVRRQRWLRFGVAMVAIFVAVFVGMELLDELEKPFRTWAVVGLTFVAISPIILWQVFFPPPIEITAHSDRIVYDFEDQVYAWEFARLNDADLPEAT